MSNIYGLIGEKLGHSFSPQIHNMIFENINPKAVYNLFEIKKENLEKAVEGLKALEARGVTVTIPYKVEIIKYLDEISPEAERIGAVNTVDFKNGKLIGYNTDYYGFGETLKKTAIDITNKSAVILGTGGASKAVVQYLIDNNIGELIYVSREPQKVNNLGDFKVISYEQLHELENKDLIINCTPCGMYPNVENSPVSKGILREFSVAVDIIYNPLETKFLSDARELNLKTINGLYMLVAQAAAAQEIWHGIEISDNVVDKIYEKLQLMIGENNE
jgi:shikimate dehydrogenase